jgi:hypothetical protein
VGNGEVLRFKGDILKVKEVQIDRSRIIKAPLPRAPQFRLDRLSEVKKLKGRQIRFDFDHTVVEIR